VDKKNQHGVAHNNGNQDEECARDLSRAARPDYAKAAEWYGKAAAQGSVLAQNYLKELKAEGKI